MSLDYICKATTAVGLPLSVSITAWPGPQVQQHWMEWKTILSIILGGALSLGGGIFTTWLKNRRDRITLFRQGIEAIRLYQKEVASTYAALIGMKHCLENGDFRFPRHIQGTAWSIYAVPLALYSEVTAFPDQIIPGSALKYKDVLPKTKDFYASLLPRTNDALLYAHEKIDQLGKMASSKDNLTELIKLHMETGYVDETALQNLDTLNQSLVSLIARLASATSNKMDAKEGS